MKSTAIVVAAGSGKRMGSDIKKQYMLLNEKPILYYSLKALQEFKEVGEIILVTSSEDIDYCRREIIEVYGLNKVKHIVGGGAERYHSVWNGLQCVEADCDFVLVQDGARPMLTEKIIAEGLDCVKQYGSAVAGVPSKDTVKILDEDNFVVDTPNRERVWNIQTPQIFRRELIMEAYQNMMEKNPIGITDDAMVVEAYTNHRVKIYMADYRNIKITTPDDLRKS